MIHQVQFHFLCQNFSLLIFILRKIITKYVILQLGQGAINMNNNNKQPALGGPVIGAGGAPSGGRYGPYRMGYQGRQDVAERRRLQPRRRFRGQPTAAKYSQVS